ncbi:hypothetical protein G6011_04326 [Alternaria panax]|uniref:F-box domain-containing protein n=1 Tax=Alternaria panax TaxID=48097 RepID=A0AAD4IGA8_9PLEO|nr:hypothetical protein G6011_04326 [Alternaria panax]
MTFRVFVDGRALVRSSWFMTLGDAVGSRLRKRVLLLLPFTKLQKLYQVEELHLGMESPNDRKTPLNQATESSQSPRLPWNVLIEIAHHCRLDELRALTMVSTQMRDLIDYHIPTIAPAVADVTFPHCERVLLHKYDRCTVFYHGQLQELISHQLAAILVNKHRIAYEDGLPCYRIPAEAPGGDSLRKRVAKGWDILRELYLISQDVRRSYTEDELAQQNQQSPRYSLNACKMKEDVVQQRRLDYVHGLCSYQVRDYILLTTLLPCVSSMSKAKLGEEYEPWIFDGGDSFDALRSFRDGITWLSWFVLAEGLHIFWAQWWSLPADLARHYIARRAVDTYKALDPALIDYQRMLTKRLHDVICDVGEYKMHDYGNLKPHLYFPYVAKGKRPLRDYRARETLQHVPFLAQFRCPDDVEEPGPFIISPW